MTVQPGDPAPAFTLPASGGRTVASTALKGRPYILYFYPKANTSGCTREAMDFTALKDRFAAADTAVLGISADPAKALKSFRAKHALGIALAGDPDKAMLEAYGVWQEKSLYGRRFMGTVRTTLLIDRDGTVAAVWEKVKVPGHAEAVLKAAEALA